MILANKSLHSVLNQWKDDEKRRLLSANPFDSNTLIHAKISLGNIDFFLGLLNTAILRGDKSSQQLAGLKPKKPNILI